MTTHASDAGWRRVLLLTVAAPALLLVAAYVWLAIDHGTLALWNVVVHENGKYTLGETILYFSHFLREVPVDIAMALFIVAGVSEVVGTNGSTVRRPSVLAIALVAAVLLPVGAFAVACGQHGCSSALTDLLQYRTRDDVSAYGSHWNYHLLSTLWFAVATPVIARLVLALTGVNPTKGDAGRGWTIAAWGYFVTLCAVFGVSMDAFRSVRYTGHQSRELMTHALITLPITIYAVIALRRSNENTVGARASMFSAFKTTPVRTLLTFAIPVYLAVVTLSGDVMSEGQTEQGLDAMVGAHFYEHVLDYLLVAAVAIAAAIGFGRSISAPRPTSAARDSAR